MTELCEKFGRSLGERVNFLQKNLTEEERKIYHRLPSFINIWTATTGGSIDINEHTEFFSKTNLYALRQIDSVFFKKYGLHIAEIPEQLDMTPDEWQNGI